METEKDENELQKGWLWKEIVSLLSSKIHILIHNL